VLLRVHGNDVDEWAVCRNNYGSGSNRVPGLGDDWKVHSVLSAIQTEVVDPESARIHTSIEQNKVPSDESI